MRDRDRGLDRLDPPADLGERVRLRLAHVARDERGQLAAVRVEHVAHAHQRPCAHDRGRRAPVGERGPRRRDRVLARRGRRLTLAEQAALVGASVSDAADGLNVPVGELRDELRAAFATATFATLPGVEALIGRLREEMPLAVARNRPHDLVLGTLRQLELDAAFAAVVSAETLPHAKPAPDVYLAACDALAVEGS